MTWFPNIEVVTDSAHIQYLRKAYEHGWNTSDDESTRNGALIVKDGQIVLYGANGYYDYYRDIPERHQRPLKYSSVKHAERDLVTSAARKGIGLEGTTLYCPWYACDICADEIRMAGIIRVVGHEDTYLKTPERWQGPIDKGIQMLHDAGVITLMYRGKIGGVQAKLNYIIWEP